MTELFFQVLGPAETAIQSELAINSEFSILKHVLRRIECVQDMQSHTVDATVDDGLCQSVSCSFKICLFSNRLPQSVRQLQNFEC